MFPTSLAPQAPPPVSAMTPLQLQSLSNMKMQNQQQQTMNPLLVQSQQQKNDAAALDATQKSKMNASISKYAGMSDDQIKAAYGALMGGAAPAAAAPVTGTLSGSLAAPATTAPSFSTLQPAAAMASTAPGATPYGTPKTPDMNEQQ